MNKPPICFYHSADLDGLCSGAIMAQAMPDADMRPYDYGEPFPWDEVEGRDVHMADVSLQPAAQMWRLASLARSLTFIDHHKSAIEEIEKLWAVENSLPLAGHLEVGRAACELCWEYYNPAPTPKPLAVELLARYDVWQWEGVEGALEFQFGMRLEDWRDVRDGRWRALLAQRTDRSIEDAIIERGRTVLTYQAQQNTIQASAKCFETEIDGLRAIACNAGPTNSQLFDSVWDPGRHDVMMPFYLHRSGTWKVSLYSTKEEIDCSAIAKARGGGGHKGAAGFSCSLLPFAIPDGATQ